MHFRPLHGDLGAEVLDFDIQHGGSPAQIGELRRAYDEYSLLLFRGGGRISPERQVEIANWFGPPWVSGEGDGEFISMLKNDESPGSMMLPFHSDYTFTDAPIRAICLHALELPDIGTSTNFVSGVAAWASLPTHLQKELASMTLRHLHAWQMPERYGQPDYVAEHPLRLLHPSTGKSILFVTERHADRILELDEERSGEVIAQLLTHLYAPQRRYVHWWQLHDLVMYDNLALQHARTEKSDPRQGPRTLQRVTLSDYSLAELEGRMRQAGAAT